MINKRTVLNTTRMVLMHIQKIALTIPEAVRISGIGRTSLYRYFSEGKLTPRKSGKRTLVIAEELEAFVKSLPAGGLAHDA